ARKAARAASGDRFADWVRLFGLQILATCHRGLHHHPPVVTPECADGRATSVTIGSVRNIAAHQIGPRRARNWRPSLKVALVSSSTQERFNTQSTPSCKSWSLNRVIFCPHLSQAATILR